MAGCLESGRTARWAAAAAVLSCWFRSTPPRAPTPSGAALTQLATTRLCRRVFAPSWLALAAVCFWEFHSSRLVLVSPQADKHAVAQRCAVPLRDLRLLDADLTTRRVLELLLLVGCATSFARAVSYARHPPLTPHAASPPRCLHVSGR